jgi:hypothetical protein
LDIKEQKLTVNVELEIPYKAIELNKMKSGQKIQDALAQMTNGTTVSLQ